MISKLKKPSVSTVYTKYFSVERVDLAVFCGFVYLPVDFRPLPV